MVVEGDLFIDCTGFRGLLIEEALHTGYEDWSYCLPCDSAIAVQTEALSAPGPCTRSIAHKNGWRWQIPLQNRTGNGIVYCSKTLSDEDGQKYLLKNIEGEPINEPRVIKYRTGTRRKHWNKNCVAIGLSSGFIEPLESTSIHLIQQSIVRLMKLFPSKEMEKANIDKFNDDVRFEIDNIRDFIVLHYHVTERSDSAFWQYWKNMRIPDTLKSRLDLFSENAQAFKKEGELFGESSWVQVMLGQGIMPKHYHSIVDLMPEDELKKFLDSIKSGIVRKVECLPKHMDFIKNYCPSK